MAFKLEIRLGRPDGVYLAGEEVTGVVTIHDPDGGSSTVQLIHEWRAHGRGSGDFGSRVERTLATVWERGATEVPFTLPMPNGPFTYRGQHTHLDWYVRVESGGVFNKTKAETSLIYGAVPAMPDVDFGPSYTPPVALASAASSAQRQTRSVVIGVVAAVIVVSLMVTQLPASFTMPFAAFLVVFVGAIFFALIRNRVAQEKLGEVKLTIAPLELRPSDGLQLRFATVAARDLTISQITVKLVQNEFYASGSGKNRSSATRAVFENVVEVSAQRIVKAREEIAFTLNCQFQKVRRRPSWHAIMR